MVCCVFQYSIGIGPDFRCNQINTNQIHLQIYTMACVLLIHQNSGGIYSCKMFIRNDTYMNWGLKMQSFVPKCNGNLSCSKIIQDYKTTSEQWTPTHQMWDIIIRVLLVAASNCTKTSCLSPRWSVPHISRGNTAWNVHSNFVKFAETFIL